MLQPQCTRKKKEEGNPIQKISNNHMIHCKCIETHPKYNSSISETIKLLLTGIFQSQKAFLHQTTVTYNIRVKAGEVCLWLGGGQ